MIEARLAFFFAVVVRERGIIFELGLSVEWTLESAAHVLQLIHIHTHIWLGIDLAEDTYVYIRIAKK